MSRPTQYIVTDAGKTNAYPNEAQPLPPPLSTRLIIEKKPTPNAFDAPTKYVEREDKYASDLEYARMGTDQGIVIIFNQVYFDYVSDDEDKLRRGSSVDVENITLTLGRLGYNVDQTYIFTSLNRKEILEKIDGICNENLSNKNSLILFFLTHGIQNDTLLTKDGEINTQDLWMRLGNHKDLKNKPKLFVFQACKGHSLSTPYRKEAALNHAISSININSYNLPSDILLCYSSAEGMKSYRDIEKGTWFIQEICRNFSNYGRRDDVVTLFTRVAKCIATYEYDETKQMPVIVSTLSRKFYLTKSKDRRQILASVELYNKINQHIRKLNSLVQVE